MKILLIFILILPLSAFSQTCSELEEDLLNIEYELLTSQLDECTESNQPQRNCRFGESNNQTYAQMLENYNKAMAKLVLHNGIEAITAAISGSHNSLAAITPVKLDQANQYIDVLEESLTKAEVLEAAMTPVEGNDQSLTSFWTKYGINENTTFLDFEDRYRAGCLENNEVLCQKITEQNIVFGPNSEVIQTLYAFMQAEMRARTSPSSNPETFYNEQREKLKITVLNQETNTAQTMSASEYRTEFFGLNGPMKRMQDAVTRLAANPTDSDARSEVLRRATALDPIDTTYAIPARPSDASANYALTVDGTLNERIQRPLIDLQIDLTDTFTTDIWETNLNRNVDRVKADQAVFEQGLSKKIDSFVSEFIQESCSSEQTPNACLRSACGLSSTVTSCQNSRLNSLGVAAIVSQMNDATQLKRLGDDFEDAKACYTRNTLELKRACLMTVADKLGYAFNQTAKQSLINDVETARRELERFNSASPFINITERKILAIAALETNDCINSDSITRNTCQETSGVDGLDEGAINLGQNLGNISIRLSQRLVNDANGAPKSAERAQDDADREESFRDRCENNRASNQVQNLCRHFSNQEERRISFQDNQRREVESVRISERRRAIEYRSSNSRSSNYYEENSGGSIGRGIAQGLLMPNPVTGQTALGNLATGTFGYFQTRDSVKNFRAQIEARSNLYDAQQAYYEANRPPYSDVIPYNGGYIHNGYLYDKNFQAQAGQGNLYAPTANPLAYNFQTSLPVSGGITSTPAVAPGSVSTPLSTTPAGSTTFSFDL